jgi:hypothetical protein
MSQTARDWRPPEIPLSDRAGDMIARQPHLAMQAVLEARKIAPASPIAQRFISQAEDLRKNYRVLAPGMVGRTLGVTTPIDPESLLNYMAGYVDMMLSTDAGMQQELAYQRAMLRSQVRAAIHDPDTQIYQETARVITPPDGIVGDPYRQLEGAGSPLGAWNYLIAPALTGLGASPMDKALAQSQFASTVNQYKMAAMQGDTRSFQQFLTEKGYSLPV